MNKLLPPPSFQGSQLNSQDLLNLFDYIAQGEAARERNGTLPHEAIELIRRSRLGALRIPLTDGGGGSTVRELFAIVIELATADANVAHILRNHFSVVERFARASQDPQSRKWRASVVDGAIIGAAVTELDSPKVGGTIPTTRFTPDGDGYRLNGRKYYSTGTLYADYVLVRAADQHDALAVTIIPVKREGVELVDDWNGSGQRLTGSGTTVFNNVRVEQHEVVYDSPSTGYGVAYANTYAQLFLTAINAGIIGAVLRDAAALVRRRPRSFYYAPAERPAEDPILQQTVGQISSNAFAAQSIVLAAADALDAASAASDRGDGYAEAAAIEAALAAARAKVIVDDLAIRSGGLLFDLGGASATRTEDNLDRHWRNARTLASHNPASYKARAVGDYEVNGTPPPGKGFF
jgi:alkylation response protein AidB-like acyl-CoA dehydrogenase